MKTPRALHFINQFASGHQYCIYNHKGKIIIQQTSQNKPQFNPLRIPTHVHSNPSCDKLISYL